MSGNMSEDKRSAEIVTGGKSVRGTWRPAAPEIVVLTFPGASPESKPESTEYVYSTNRTPEGGSLLTISDWAKTKPNSNLNP